jgi:hypothetical protein
VSYIKTYQKRLEAFSKLFFRIIVFVFLSLVILEIQFNIISTSAAWVRLLEIVNGHDPIMKSLLFGVVGLHFSILLLVFAILLLVLEPELKCLEFGLNAVRITAAGILGAALTTGVICLALMLTATN